MYRIPLFTQFPVLLLIGCVEPQQRLQVASVRFHILVVHVNIVQVLLLLEDLFCCTWRKQKSVCINRNEMKKMVLIPEKLNI